MDPIKNVVESIKKQNPVQGVLIEKPAEWQSNCRPDCEICHGIGWLRQELPVTDPKFGKLIPCPNRVVDQKIESGLTSTQRDLDWTDIQMTKDVILAVKTVRKAISERYGWVYLYGSSGLAKSLILQVVIADEIRSGRRARYANMIDILDNIRQAYDTETPSTEAARRLERWSTIPVLAIDEVDRITGTKWADGTQFQLFDKRYTDGVEGRSVTILASNANPASFEEYLRSRIFDGRFSVVHLTGIDKRPQMIRERKDLE
jgi:DNA replication protein DnaC